MLLYINYINYVLSCQVMLRIFGNQGDGSLPGRNQGDGSPDTFFVFLIYKKVEWG